LTEIRRSYIINPWSHTTLRESGVHGGLHVRCLIAVGCKYVSDVFGQEKRGRIWPLQPRACADTPRRRTPLPLRHGLLRQEVALARTRSLVPGGVVESSPKSARHPDSALYRHHLGMHSRCAPRARNHPRLAEVNTPANQSIEPTGGSPFRQSELLSQRRLPPVAHARTWMRKS
jgi:hypothetical protein